MSRLFKQKTRKDGSRQYFQWMITIPPDVVGDVGWRDGQEVEVTAEGGAVILRAKVGAGKPRRDDL